MKQSLIFKNRIAILVVLISTFFVSCIKDRNGQVDFSGLSPIMQIKEGGLDQFGKQALLFPASHVSDTAYFRANYAATNVAPKDIVVTLAVDVAALAAYNATVPVSAQYVKFPDSIYRFTQTQVTVKAGQSYSDVVKLTVFPNKVDPSKNYMLPITITDAQGVTISGNFGTIYYHFIGNCLAGTYNVVGTRYNYNGVVGYSGGPIPPATAGTATVPAVKVLAPVNASTTFTDYANLGAGTARDYFFTYDCAAGGTNIDATFTQSFLDGTSNVAFIIHNYDPVTKKIHMLSTYNNAAGGTGNDRIVDEVFTHQ